MTIDMELKHQEKMKALDEEIAKYERVIDEKLRKLDIDSKCCRFC